MQHASYRCFFLGFAWLVLCSGAVAQEAPDDSQAPKAEKTYFDLRRSKDRTTQLLAERYFNLVKLQEWSDLTGKFKTTAKYVEHDPNLTWVKLEIVRGRERTTRQIPVDKLSKTCQSRVKQIDIIQKKLDELLATSDVTSDQATPDAGGPIGPEVGAPMLDESGQEPRTTRRRLQTGTSQPREPSPPTVATPAAEQPQPTSASNRFDPDPLGFAEMDLSAAPPAAASTQAVPSAGSALGPSIPRQPPRGNVDRGQWATSYRAFFANLKVTLNTEGAAQVDYGELAKVASGPGPFPMSAPPLEVSWEGRFKEMQAGEDGLTLVFDLPPPPPPLELQFRADQKSPPEIWSHFSAGDPIHFEGRVRFTGPTSIVVEVREPRLATTK